MMERSEKSWKRRYPPAALDEIMSNTIRFKRMWLQDLDVGDTLAMSYGTNEDLYRNFSNLWIWDGYGPKKQFMFPEEFYDQSGWKLSQAASGRYLMDLGKNNDKTEQNAFIRKYEPWKQRIFSLWKILAHQFRYWQSYWLDCAVTCLCAYLLIYNIIFPWLRKVHYYGLT